MDAARTLTILLSAKQTESGGRRIAVSTRALSSRMRWVINATPRPLYPWKGTLPSLYTRLVGSQGRDRRGPKNLACTGIRSLDWSFFSESIFRLRYPYPMTYQAKS
jgi:hypothetical protein